MPRAPIARNAWRRDPVSSERERTSNWFWAMRELLAAPSVSTSSAVRPASTRPRRQPPYTPSTVRFPDHRTAHHAANSPNLHPRRVTAGGVSLRMECWSVPALAERAARLPCAGARAVAPFGEPTRTASARTGQEKGGAMEWLNEPPAWEVRGETLIVTAGPQTDFWRTTHYGFVRDTGHLWLPGVGAATSSPGSRSPAPITTCTTRRD